MGRFFKRAMQRCVVVVAVACGALALSVGSNLCDLPGAGAQESAQGGAVSAGAPGSSQGGVYAPAPVESSHQGGIGSAFMNLLPMLLLCMLVFHFMVLRPQEAKAKAHKELLESLKKGDEVITSSGIVGKLMSTDSEVLSLEIAPSVRIRVERAHIMKRLDVGAKASAA